MSRITRRIATSARFLLGAASGPFLPEEVVFEVTTACNLACPMCARTVAAPRAPGRLDAEAFARRLARIPREVTRIAIAGLGEPLLNPDIVSMVRCAAAGGRQPVLYTNATLLTPQMSAQLLDAGLRGVVIPIDGATSETYERYRVNASFSEVTANVRSLLEQRSGRGAAIFVELQMLALPGTRSQVRQWRAEWRKAGADSLRYKPDHMGVLAAAGGPSPPTAPLRGVCPMPWRGPATIDIDGSVYPCCVQDPGNAVLGNIEQDPLDQIWNGARAVSLRTEFVRTRAKLPTCLGCRVPLPPVPVAAAANLLDPFTVRRWLSLTERWLPTGGRGGG